MVRKYSTDLVIPPGFAEHWHDEVNILLPLSVAAEISLNKVEAAYQKLAAKAQKPTAIPARLGGKPLPKIRIGTKHDFNDAQRFAQKILKDVEPTSLLSAQMSEDLLVAVLIVSAFEPPEAIAYGMDDVLNHVVDPGWDGPRQISSNMINKAGTLDLSHRAKVWLSSFANKLDSYCKAGRAATDMFKAANLHWSKALKPKRKASKPTAQTQATASQTIQVFSAEALEQATIKLDGVRSDEQASGVRILEQAKTNRGIRTLPDALQASTNLEDKKRNFENLVQPIEHMQTSLVLAAAMQSQEFRIAPILLLGAPGIGKTFLASQLAQALGVPSAKISAGGAQGGFQLVGSHSSWRGAKPGMVAELLALSDSAAPVLVIDEVDKIHDAQYPFLPVLLDLLDAGTAKRFRDEYFEMDMDASRIMVVLTANDISKVPSPLLSRVEVFTIASPEPSQRLRIIQQTMADLVLKTNQQITLDCSVAERLADRMDIDLRQLDRLIHFAFAKALQAGEKVARIKTPDCFGATAFDLRAWTPECELRT